MPRFTARAAKQCKLPSDGNGKSKGGRRSCEIIRETQHGQFRVVTQWNQVQGVPVASQKDGLQWKVSPQPSRLKAIS